MHDRQALHERIQAAYVAHGIEMLERGLEGRCSCAECVLWRLYERYGWLS